MMVHLVDLEFSEILEINPRISGGLSSFQDSSLDLNQDIDLDFEVPIEVAVDIDSSGLVVMATGTIQTDAVVPPGCLGGGPCNFSIVLVNNTGIPIEVTGPITGVVSY